MDTDVKWTMMHIIKPEAINSRSSYFNKWLTYYAAHDSPATQSFYHTYVLPGRPKRLSDSCNANMRKQYILLI